MHTKTLAKNVQENEQKKMVKRQQDKLAQDVSRQQKDIRRFRNVNYILDSNAQSLFKTN